MGIGDSKEVDEKNAIRYSEAFMRRYAPGVYDDYGCQDRVLEMEQTGGNTLAHAADVKRQVVNELLEDERQLIGQRVEQLKQHVIQVEKIEPCAKQRSRTLDCLRTASDPLRCSDQVEAFTRCARAIA